jgi:hypothetical protein
MPDVRCPTCGNYTPEGRFCERCGSPLIPVPVNSPTPQEISAPQVPGKKRSTAATILIILGVVFILLIVLSVIAAFVYGMAANIDTTKNTKPTVTVTPVYTYLPTAVVTRVTASPTIQYAPDSYSKTIPDGYYWYYYIPLKSGDHIRATFSTDGSPLDLMIMGSTDFGKYKSSFSSSQVTWFAWNDLNIVKDQYNFVAKSDDTYYFVFDNTKSPTNGAYAGKDVNLAATFIKS